MDPCPTPAPTILEWSIKRAGPERALCCQRHETKATQTISQRRTSPQAESQSAAWPAGLRGFWQCAISLKPPLRPRNYPDGVYQQVSQQPTSRQLWYQENTWAYSPKILLANVLPWRQGLYKGMQCMLSLKSSPTQALWWLTILANFYPPLEGFIDGFCHGFASFDGLEGGQLWLDTCHRQPAHEDGSLRASQGHHRCSGPCWGHHRRGSEASRPPGLNRHRPGVALHLEVLVIAMLFPRHQAEAINRLPSSDGWPNWEAE